MPGRLLEARRGLEVVEGSWWLGRRLELICVYKREKMERERRGLDTCIHARVCVCICT